VENVIPINENQYLLSGTCEEMISDLQERYNGSKIFHGSTLKRVEDMDGNKFKYKLFRTIVSKSKVIQKDELPYEIL